MTRPPIPGLTQREREHVAMLVRRAQWCATRAAELGAVHGGWSRHEFKAICWALSRILTPEECAELGVPETVVPRPTHPLGPEFWGCTRTETTR